MSNYSEPFLIAGGTNGWSLLKIIAVVIGAIVICALLAALGFYFYYTRYVKVTLILLNNLFHMTI
jgi:hypothetical protein